MTDSRSQRGSGSLRERRPGVRELRVTVGQDAVSGRSLKRSFTHHGDEEGATRRLAELVEMHGVQAPKPIPQSAAMTVQQLLDAPHRWSVTTWRVHRGQSAMLCADRIRSQRLDRMNPNSMERQIERWTRAGVTASNLSGRYRTLHAAITWAVTNQLPLADPLAGMTCPSRPRPRLHLPLEDVRRLFTTADDVIRQDAEALADRPHENGRCLALFRAEQDALMVRLAADAAARRGELVALTTADLDGRILSIKRASQDGVIGPVKNHLDAKLTLSRETAAYWTDHVEHWRAVRNQGPWLFTATPQRAAPLLPNGLGQRFQKLAHLAGIPDATLHRLRHTVGTCLVSQGKILQASKRL